MRENKQGRSYNQSALIFSSIIFAPILFCGGCLFLWFSPWVTWLHANEMQSVLENYERVRSAVFDGREQPEKLLDIAATSHFSELNRLLAYLEVDSQKYKTPQVIDIAQVREYEADCSVVILNRYFDLSDVVFILSKANETWKIERIKYGIDTGLFGDLPVICSKIN